MKELQQINIYDLSVELIDDLFRLIESDDFNEDRQFINYLFNRLLRSVEISPSTVIPRLRRRIPLQLVDELNFYISLQKLFLKIFDITKDLRYLNSVLKLNDLSFRNFGLKGVLLGIKSNYSVESKNIRNELNEYILNINSHQYKNVIIHDRIVQDEHLDWFDHKRDACSNGVVIFCPNSRSLYTLCVAEMMRRSGIKVELIVVKRIFNFTRILNELKRDGPYWLFKKFIQRYLFRSYTDYIVPGRSLAELSRKLNVDKLDVNSWCEKFNADIISTDDFNSWAVESVVATKSLSLGVFTGGGLIKGNLLTSLSLGIVNCHGGMLPAYRGLDVEKWAVLEGNMHAIGCSAHLMSETVDEGGLLMQYRSILSKSDQIESLGYNLEMPQCVLLVKATLEYLEGHLVPIEQVRSHGRQFYYMHATLVNVVKARLANFNNFDWQL